MDPRAVKKTDLDATKPYFIMNAVKQDGTKRLRYYRKFNHALRALYRIVRIEQGTVSVKEPGRRTPVKIIMRFRKKRGFNTEMITSLEDRPTFKEVGRFWHRMPRAKFNDIK